MKGKKTCKILKEIRKQIAEENDIELVTSECTYQGDCKGTCPKCEAEVRYLERELEKRQRMGKAAVFAGMSLGTLFAATSCDRIIPQPLAGEPCVPDTTEMTNDSIPSDTIPEEPFMLEGDVVAPVSDTLRKESNQTCQEIDKEKYIEQEGEIVETIPIDVVEGEIENDLDDTYVYQIIEQMPEFPGGNEKLMEFVLSNSHYPQEAKEKGVQGRVHVNFVVDTDGSISDVKVLKGVGGGCDEEAVRVVKSMPKWQPGRHRGKVVKVSYTLPFDFKL